MAVKNKINRKMLGFSILLLVSQLIVLMINSITSSLPWKTDGFWQSGGLNVALRLAIYFLLGICGIIGVAISLVSDNKAKEQKPESVRDNVKKLAVCAVMLALYITIQSFALDITEYLRISFNYLIIAVIGMLYGASTGAVFGIAADLLGFIVHPGVGGFFPAYTVISALQGTLYGTVLYKGKLSSIEKQPPLWKIALVRGIDVLLCSTLCRTWVNSFFYGQAFWAILPVRALKNLVMYPVEVLLLWCVLNALFKINKESKLKL